MRHDITWLQETHVGTRGKANGPEKKSGIRSSKCRANSCPGHNSWNQHQLTRDTSSARSHPSHEWSLTLWGCPQLTSSAHPYSTHPRRVTQPGPTLVINMCGGWSRAGCGLTSSRVIELWATPPRRKYTTITSARPLDRETRIPDWKGRKPRKNYLSTQPRTKAMVATTLSVLLSQLEFG